MRSLIGSFRFFKCFQFRELETHFDLNKKHWSRYSLFSKLTFVLFRERFKHLAFLIALRKFKTLKSWTLPFDLLNNLILTILHSGNSWISYTVDYQNHRRQKFTTTLKEITKHFRRSYNISYRRAKSTEKLKY